MTRRDLLIKLARVLGVTTELARERSFNRGNITNKHNRSSIIKTKPRRCCYRCRRRARASMKSSHRPRPKQAHDAVARSWPRCLSWPQPAAPGTPLGPLMPIGQQHTQHVAEARSALARGAMMASRHRCAIVHAMRGLPAGRRVVQRFCAGLAAALFCFLVRARPRGTHRSQVVNRLSNNRRSLVFKTYYLGRA